jgi:outer membrane lipoprotein-sorting protein
LALRAKRERYRLRKSCLFLVASLLLLSCAKKNVEVDLGKINLLEVLKKVQEAQQSVRSIKGLASVTIKAPDKRISFNQVTIAEEPNLLHLEALALFGKVAGTIISDGEKIYVTFPKERRIFDKAQEFDFSTLYTGLPVKITTDELVNLLLGRLAGPPDYDLSQVNLSVKSNYLILTFIKNGKEEGILWANPLNYRIERANLNLGERVSASYRFNDFKDAGSGVFFPKKIELKVDHFSISLKYDDEVEVNGKIDRNSFLPEQPLAEFEKAF